MLFYNLQVCIAFIPRFDVNMQSARVLQFSIKALVCMEEPYWAKRKTPFFMHLLDAHHPAKHVCVLLSCIIYGVVMKGCFAVHRQNFEVKRVSGFSLECWEWSTIAACHPVVQFRIMYSEISHVNSELHQFTSPLSEWDWMNLHMLSPIDPA